MTINAQGLQQVQQHVCTIGIIGFGIVGQAALRFFIHQPERLQDFLGLAADVTVRIVVWDQKEFLPEQEVFFRSHNIVWLTHADVSLPIFFEQVDRVLVSPGVGLQAVALAQQKKAFCELDVVENFFTGESIGITGSLGKTTITKLIYKLLKRFRESQLNLHDVALGGNVGIGMLDLLNDATVKAWAVLELSSFQLERNNVFAPTIGVWTNLFPNHLDRHESMAGYFAAKATLFTKQQSHATTILGTQLFDASVYSLTVDFIHQVQSTLVIAGATSLTQAFIDLVPHKKWTAWMVLDGMISRYSIVDGVIESKQPLMPLSVLPPTTFQDNWVVVFAALHAAGVDCAWLAQDVQNNPSVYAADDQHHRLEFVCRTLGIDFYNDSKSTLQEATLGAVTQLALTYKRVHVIIGGLSKGADRTNFVFLLQQVPTVINIIAFGKEAELFKAPLVADSLEQAVQKAFSLACEGDVILFSPGGASFDLFKNYEHRGNEFTALVGALNS